MALLTPDEAREYLRATSDEVDDIMVNSYISAAEMYLKNAGCVLNPDDELAKLAEKMLVVKYYEERDSESRSSVVADSALKLDVGLKSIILQLQLLEVPADESGTTES